MSEANGVRTRAANDHDGQLRPGREVRSGNANLSGQQALRELAARGALAAKRSEDDQRRLRREAFAVVWPLVFDRHTRRIELKKGHTRCAASVNRLADECVDGFHDDVESVLDYLFRCRKPIHNLEGWLITRIGPATIDGHRRRRGAIGAPQRPRVAGWLREALGGDPWLIELASKIIEWAGVPSAAGETVWPVDSWAELWTTVVDHSVTRSPERVASDVEHVLRVMRTTDPEWYDRCIERPLGHKRAPLVMMRSGADDAQPLILDENPEARDPTDIAAIAVKILQTRLADEVDPVVVVREVISTLFLGPLAASRGMAAQPHFDSEPDIWISEALADEIATARLTKDILAILDPLT